MAKKMPKYMVDKVRRMNALMQQIVDLNMEVEEWLGKTKDCGFLRDLYEEQRSGFVHGLWDGRCLSALERRGYIRYYDDMQSNDWAVRLIEG